MLLFNNKVICNFYLNPEEEAEILTCFTDDEFFLVFPFYKDNFFYDKELKQFVYERVVGIENDYTYLVRPNSFEELVDIIKNDPITYRCRVVQMSSSKLITRFKLHIYEHYGFPDMETRALIIDEELSENDYLCNIQPKIKETISKLFLTDFQ